MSFQLTDRKSYGYASALEEAKAPLRKEYLTWKGTDEGRAG
ncbi:MAG TPA: hypothetical protein VG291_11310 [Xanthobacteraceae bacterium]|nr:hypothetical protein [Xanthobacteraceae bacterium]